MPWFVAYYGMYNLILNMGHVCTDSDKRIQNADCEYLITSKCFYSCI